MRNAAIWLVCGLITVVIGVWNIWAGIIAMLLLYSVASSLTSE